MRRVRREWEGKGERGRVGCIQVNDLGGRDVLGDLA